MFLGIYFHIPFCKNKCIYCDFYSTTDKSIQDAVLQAMMQEISLRRNEYAGFDSKQATIYFGGGTPSILSADQIAMLANKAVNEFGIQCIEEFTVEANPDDLTSEYLSALKNIGTDRISIGIQSFCNEDLRFMRRRHSAQQAINSVEMAHKAGFTNISIDLIYGLPNQTIKQWEQNLRTAFSLNIKHLSAYCLTAEPHTLLGNLLHKKLAALPDEDITATQYDTLRNQAQMQDFEHYEVSNFVLGKRYSLHNSNYWRNVPYAGIGAAAHSYNGNSRRANVADVRQYIQGISSNGIYFETELLTTEEIYNELILKGLRTQWGVDTAEINRYAGSDFAEYFLQNADNLIADGRLLRNGTNFTIPQNFWFVGDGIMSNLLI